MAHVEPRMHDGRHFKNIWKTKGKQRFFMFPMPYSGTRWHRLAPIGSQVGRNWPQGRRSWPQVCTSWTQVGPKLAPSWLQERKKTEPNEQMSGRDEQRDENCDFEFQLMVRKVILLDAKWCGSIFKNLSPAQAGISFFKKT